MTALPTHLTTSMTSIIVPRIPGLLQRASSGLKAHELASEVHIWTHMAIVCMSHRNDGSFA